MGIPGNEALGRGIFKKLLCVQVRLTPFITEKWTVSDRHPEGDGGGIQAHPWDSLRGRGPEHQQK